MKLVLRLRTMFLNALKVFQQLLSSALPVTHEKFGISLEVGLNICDVFMPHSILLIPCSET